MFFGFFGNETAEQKLEKSIKKKLKELNSIRTLNHGGCAITALALHKYIKKNYPDVEPTIVYLFSDCDDSYEAMKAGFARSCGHAVVKINGLYLDSHGFRHPLDVKRKMWLTRSLDVEPEIAHESINRREWNPSFDREEHVPTICSILEMDEQFKSTIKVW